MEIGDCFVRHWSRLGRADARFSMGCQQVGGCFSNITFIYVTIYHLFIFNNSATKPSLRTVPQAEFQEQLTTLLKDHMVVAFEENGVSANAN